MKYKIITFVAFVIVFIVSGLLIKQDKTPITSTQLSNMSLVVDRIFVPEQLQATDNTQATASGDSIIAIIYQKSKATWFFKARGKSSLIDQQSATFSRLFLDQLKFDENEQPILTHIPQEMQRPSNQSMREATFNLNGLEVSVSQLAGTQDIRANIFRWRKQLSMTEEAPEFVKYQNENTVLVKLDQHASPEKSPTDSTASSPQAPEKENMDDFLNISLPENWQRTTNTGAMSSGELLLDLAGQQYQVAVLRLPSNVPIGTILNIWREKAGVPAAQALEKSEITNNTGQIWQVIPMYSEQTNIIIAMHQGATRFTFFRLSSDGLPSEAVKASYQQLLKNTQIIKE